MTADVEFPMPPVVALTELHSHPLNPRRAAVADEELVASIRAVGVLQALTVAPREAGGFWVIAGHCRADGAAKAGLTEVPVVVRADLATDAQQLEAMLVENGRRTDLTAVEEAEGYQQLELFGLNARDISTATGQSVKTVKSRLRLNTLTSTAKDRLHTGNITLTDAEALLEFADDHDTLADLEEHLGTSNFRWRLQQARDGRERRAQNRARIDAFEKAGAKHTPVDSEWRVAPSDVDPATHDGCLGWTQRSYDHAVPFLVCTDPARHADALDVDDDEPTSTDHHAEFEQRQAERAAARAAEVAAAKVRVEHLATAFAPLVAPLSSGAHDALRVVLPELLTGGFDEDAFAHAAGLGDGRGWELTSAYAQELPGKPKDQVLAAFACFLAAAAESALHDAEHAPRVWQWLTEHTDYQLSDVDQALHARHTTESETD